MEETARIMLVEDNPLDVELTLDAFKEARFSNQFQVMETGEDAAKYLLGEGEYADRTTHPLPDLILLDLKLPGISGHDLLEEVKKVPPIRRIPVIVLTSSSEEGDRALSYDKGANSYLVKPVSFEGFVSVVKKIGDYWFSLNVAPPIE